VAYPCGFCKGGLLFGFLTPTGLRRHYGQGDLHFVTFCCCHRRRHLQTARVRNLFLKVLAEVRVKHDFRLVGYVVMPDQVHLLISEPKKGNISKVLQVLKQRVSRKMRGKRSGASRKQLRLNFGEAWETDRRFWQRRFYDFNVWSHEKKKEKLHYMHANPVRERMVQHPKEWPWSSFSFYANQEDGLISIDTVD
jgi:putative transposase